MPGADRAVRAVVRVVVAVVVMAVVVCRGRLGQVILLASSTNVHVGQYMGISLGCGSDRRRWAKSNGLRVGRQSIGWCVVWVWQRRCVSKESEWSDRRRDWLPGRVGTWIDFGGGGLLGFVGWHGWFGWFGWFSGSMFRYYGWGACRVPRCIAT